jgi:hypothetical protein
LLKSWKSPVTSFLTYIRATPDFAICELVSFRIMSGAKNDTTLLEFWMSSFTGPCFIEEGVKSPFDFIDAFLEECLTVA